MKIFVSLGTHSKEFNRPLKKLDELLEEKKISASVFAVKGNSGYVPKNYECVERISFSDFQKKMSESDLVISHGGTGSVVLALNYGKPLIVVPRMSEKGEHTDNHQVDLAKAMHRTKRAIAVFDMRYLESAIKNSKKAKTSGKEKQRLVKRLKEFIGGCS